MRVSKSLATGVVVAAVSLSVPAAAAQSFHRHFGLVRASSRQIEQVRWAPDTFRGNVSVHRGGNNVAVARNTNVNVSGNGGHWNGPGWGGVAAGAAVGVGVGVAASAAARSASYPPPYPYGYAYPYPYLPY